MITLDEAERFSYSDYSIGKRGILVTFDDGLSDHYLAAQILAEQGIQGVFFIPTTILAEKLPANPMIIHYALAKYSMSRFLQVYREGLEEYGLDRSEYEIKYDKYKDDPWKVIAVIKSVFQYKLTHIQSRKILLFIYRNLLFADEPEILETIHLTQKQIRQILQMGHCIGVHSHSHISIAAKQLSGRQFMQEMVEPKRILERMFNVRVRAFSYPHGEGKECLWADELFKRRKEYMLAYTIEEKMNTKETSPFELGRYMLTSRDNTGALQRALKRIIEKSEAMA